MRMKLFTEDVQMPELHFYQLAKLDANREIEMINSFNTSASFFICRESAEQMAAEEGLDPFTHGVIEFPARWCLDLACRKVSVSHYRDGKWATKVMTKNGLKEAIQDFATGVKNTPGWLERFQATGNLPPSKES